MSEEPLISVRGEAVLEVDPEIARVHITVAAGDKDRRRAVDLLTRRNAEMLALVKGYGDAVEKVQSEAVGVRPVLKEGKPRERVVGYQAWSGLDVTVQDFTVLGELIMKAADRELTEVAGPWWMLRPTSPVWREARLAAAADALRRARDYAGAFGGQVTGLVEVADQQLLAGPPERRAPQVLAPMMGKAAAAGPPDFDLEPAKQVVHGQVEARFTMSQPRLDT